MQLKRCFLALMLISLLFVGSSGGSSQASPTPHLGYGFNVATLDYDLLSNMGFNWVKLFGPPGSPQPANVLLRVDANVTDFGDLASFGTEMAQLASNHGAFIEAYEIGNEPNLDASYGWAAPPVAQDYVQLLCTAYSNIKAHDPSAIVVSAGLAPTGRVTGNWGGHPGHNGLFQDEREFLKEFIAAGGGSCLDAVGYHPYGFSADFDAQPDVASGDSELNCVNGFCFRGTEKIYEIMQQNGLGDVKIWATEFGWLTEPPAHCLDDPGWAGREWQIVSHEKQADNLRGAFRYADRHWPWMGGMFIFNLNFNTSGWYEECEQMIYYSVEERPAEDALRNMWKNPASIAPWLKADVVEMALLTTPGNDVGLTYSVKLTNSGWSDGSFDVTADNGADIVPQIAGGSGSVAATGETTFTVTIMSGNRPVGLYTGSVTITANPGTHGVPITIPINVHVGETLHQTLQPVIFQQ